MFQTVYLVTSELYPTRIRATVNGIANFIGRFGGLLAPLIVELERKYFMLIFGGATLLSITGALFQKETKGAELED